MAAAATASVHTRPSLPSITRISGTDAAAAVPEEHPICSYWDTTCTRLPYSANYCRTSAQGLLPRYKAISWADTEVRLKTRLKNDDSGHLVVPLRPKSSRGCGLGFFGIINGRKYDAAHHRTTAAAAVGSDFAAFSGRWTEEAVENSGLKKVMIELLRSLESRRRSREKRFSRLTAAIVAITAAGLLNSKFAAQGGARRGGRFFMTSLVILGMAAACVLGVLVPYCGSSIEGTWERLQSGFAQAGEQLQNLGGVMFDIVVSASPNIGSALSSRSRGAVEDSERNLSEAGNAVGSTAEAARGSRNVKGEDDVVWGNQPDTEAVIAKISQSVGHLRRIIAVMEVAAARPDSVVGVESGIQGLYRELNFLEATILKQKKQVQRHSGIISDDPSKGTSSANSNACRNRCDGLEGTEGWTAGSNFVECAISDHSERETCDLPKLSGDATFSDSAKSENRARASDRGVMAAADSLFVEAWTRLLWKEDPGNLNSINEGNDEENKTEFQNLSPSVSSNSIVLEGGRSLTNDSGAKNYQEVEMVERQVGLSVPKIDPWQEDTSTLQPSTAGEFSAVAAGEEDEIFKPRLSWRNGVQVGQMLHVVLVVNGGEKTEERQVSSIVEGIAKGKRGSSYGSVDFWGKNAGSSRTSCWTGEQQQQRRALTRSKATGRGGSGFGSLHDRGEEENWSQQQDPAWGIRRRMAGEDQDKDQSAQFVRNERRGTSSSSRAGQPWNDDEGPEVSDRVGRRYEHPRLGCDEDDGGSAATADEYDLYRTSSSSSGNNPQTLRGARNLSTRNAWQMEDERVSRVSSIEAVNLNPRGLTGSRSGPPPDSRTGSSPSRSLEGGRSDNNAQQAIGKARYVDREGRGVDDGDFGLSDKTSGDVLSNSEGREYEKSGFGSSSSSAYAAVYPQSGGKSETSERSLALERSKQVPTPQIGTCLEQAEGLLEEGMQGLEGRIEVGVAEGMLYDAARLFESASEMDPTDLTAVGQWGNALLVHGELKLKVSQQIRSMLPAVPKYLPKSSFPFLRGAARRAKEEEAEREREAVELTLQEVCEECEELLVDAGRKYRWALGLDRSDVRGLYNWGLALCFRGQLITEEGGERAIEDADKVYLAAIDKFEAMLGTSQDYAAGALLNWGMALRDRSRLRKMGDKERIQLLLQARERFREAVRVDSNYGQARGAMMACTTELKELRNYESSVQIQQEPQQEPIEKPFRGWWQRRD